MTPYRDHHDEEASSHAMSATSNFSRSWNQQALTTPGLPSIRWMTMRRFETTEVGDTPCDPPVWATRRRWHHIAVVVVHVRAIVITRNWTTSAILQHRDVNHFGGTVGGWFGWSSLLLQLHLLSLNKVLSVSLSSWRLLTSARCSYATRSKAGVLLVGDGGDIDVYVLWKTIPGNCH